MERFLTTEYGRIGYDVEGPVRESDLPLVLLHGRVGDSTMWCDLVRRFSDERTVIAIDLPCHGRSVPCEGFHYGRVACHVAEVLAREGVDRALIVGHSTGGAVAQVLTAEWPDMVAGLLIADCAPVDPAAFSAFDRFVLKRSASSMRVYEERSARRLKHSLARDLAVSKPARASLVEIFERYSDLQLCSLTGCADGELVRFLERMERPLSLSCPVRLVLGAKDRVNRTAKQMRAWAKKDSLPLTELQRAGHYAPLDAPEEFAACVHDFIATLAEHPESEREPLSA